MTFMHGDRKPKSSEDEDVGEERFLSPPGLRRDSLWWQKSTVLEAAWGVEAEAGGDWFHCLGGKTNGLECPALSGPSDSYTPFPKSFKVSCARYLSAVKIKRRPKPNWRRKGLFHLTGYRLSRKAVRGGTWKQELNEAGARGSSAYWLTP